LKNCGKIFEEDFAKSFEKEVFIYKLRDSAGAWNGQEERNKSNGGIRFTTTNICDFIVYSNKSNKLLLLELKSFKGKSCPFSNLKEHQIKSLYLEGQKEGLKAYFVLNFRDLIETYAIDAELIYDFYKRSERKSFDYNWCKENGVFIAGELKRTRFEYQVERLMQGG
jgi:recombination protein U